MSDLCVDESFYHPAPCMRKRGYAFGFVHLLSPSLLLSVIKNIRDLQAITIVKLEGIIEIPKIDVCVPDNDQNNSCLHISSSLLPRAHIRKRG